MLGHLASWDREKTHSWVSCVWLPFGAPEEDQDRELQHCLPWPFRVTGRGVPVSGPLSHVLRQQCLAPYKEYTQLLSGICSHTVNVGDVLGRKDLRFDEQTVPHWE